MPELTPGGASNELLDEAAEAYAAGRLGDAAAACHAALDADPDSVAARSLLGMIEEERGNYAAALAEYEAVLRLAPERTVERERAERLRALVHAQAGPAIPPGLFAWSRERWLPLAAAAGVACLVLVVGAILLSGSGKTTGGAAPLGTYALQAPLPTANVMAPPLAGGDAGAIAELQTMPGTDPMPQADSRSEPQGENNPPFPDLSSRSGGGGGGAPPVDQYNPPPMPPPTVPQTQGPSSGQSGPLSVTPGPTASTQASTSAPASPVPSLQSSATQPQPARGRVRIWVGDEEPRRSASGGAAAGNAETWPPVSPSGGPGYRPTESIRSEGSGVSLAPPAATGSEVLSPRRPGAAGASEGATRTQPGTVPAPTERGDPYRAVPAAPTRTGSGASAVAPGRGAAGAGPTGGPLSGGDTRSSVRNAAPPQAREPLGGTPSALVAPATRMFSGSAVETSGWRADNTLAATGRRATTPAARPSGTAQAPGASGASSRQPLATAGAGGVGQRSGGNSAWLSPPSSGRSSPAPRPSAGAGQGPRASLIPPPGGASGAEGSVSRGNSGEAEKRWSQSVQELDALRRRAQEAWNAGRVSEARSLYRTAAQRYEEDARSNPGRAAASRSAAESCRRALEALDAGQ